MSVDACHGIMRHDALQSTGSMNGRSCRTNVLRAPISFSYESSLLPLAVSLAVGNGRLPGMLRARLVNRVKGVSAALRRGSGIILGTDVTLRSCGNRAEVGAVSANQAYLTLTSYGHSLDIVMTASSWANTAPQILLSMHTSGTADGL